MAPETPFMHGETDVVANEPVRSPRLVILGMPGSHLDDLISLVIEKGGSHCVERFISVFDDNVVPMGLSDGRMGCEVMFSVGGLVDDRRDGMEMVYVEVVDDELWQSTLKSDISLIKSLQGGFLSFRQSRLLETLFGGDETTWVQRRKTIESTLTMPKVSLKKAAQMLGLEGRAKVRFPHSLIYQNLSDHLLPLRPHHKTPTIRTAIATIDNRPGRTAMDLLIAASALSRFRERGGLLARKSDLLLLHTESIGGEMDEKDVRDFLDRMGVRLVQVPWTIRCAEKIDPDVLCVEGQKERVVGFSLEMLDIWAIKHQILGLEEYDRVYYIDQDIVFLGSSDHQWLLPRAAFAEPVFADHEAAGLEKDGEGDEVVDAPLGPFESWGKPWVFIAEERVDSLESFLEVAQKSLQSTLQKYTLCSMPPPKDPFPPSWREPRNPNHPQWAERIAWAGRYTWSNGGRFVVTPSREAYIDHLEVYHSSALGDHGWYNGAGKSAPPLPSTASKDTAIPPQTPKSSPYCETSNIISNRPLHSSFSTKASLQRGFSTSSTSRSNGFRSPADGTEQPVFHFIGSLLHQDAFFDQNIRSSTLSESSHLSGHTNKPWLASQKTNSPLISLPSSISSRSLLPYILQGYRFRRECVAGEFVLHTISNVLPYLPKKYHNCANSTHWLRYPQPSTSLDTCLEPPPINPHRPPQSILSSSTSYTCPKCSSADIAIRSARTGLPFLNGPYSERVHIRTTRALAVYTACSNLPKNSLPQTPKQWFNIVRSQSHLLRLNFSQHSFGNDPLIASPPTLPALLGLFAASISTDTTSTPQEILSNHVRKHRWPSAVFMAPRLADPYLTPPLDWASLQVLLPLIQSAPHPSASVLLAGRSKTPPGLLERLLTSCLLLQP